MFIINGDVDATSTSHSEAVLAFITSPAMLVPEQGPVAADQLAFVEVPALTDGEQAWTWELLDGAPRIGDLDDDPPQNSGVVRLHVAKGVYLVTVDSGERLPTNELLESGPNL